MNGDGWQCRRPEENFSTSKSARSCESCGIVEKPSTAAAAALANSFAFLDYISTFDVSFYDASKIRNFPSSFSLQTPRSTPATHKIFQHFYFFIPFIFYLSSSGHCQQQDYNGQNRCRRKSRISSCDCEYR